MPVLSFLNLDGAAVRRAALSAAAACAVALAGCAVTPTHGPSTSTATPELSTQTMHAYRGRFSVRYLDQNGRSRNAYGNFDLSLIHI